MTPPVRLRRSLLFVPAVHPDRYFKALATGTDAVCLDLEDGVAPGAKDEARVAALSVLANRAPTRAEVSLRINDPKTNFGQCDLDALLGAANMGDMGTNFPSSDPSYKDADSGVLLQRVAGLLRGVRPIGDWSMLTTLSTASVPSMESQSPGRSFAL